MTWAMLDIETLSTTEWAVITSIAAVTAEGKEFYVRVLPESQEQRVIDAETVKWWISQGGSEATQEMIQEPAFSLREALQSLKRWWKAWRLKEVWCHKEFDIRIVENACRDLELDVPWSYRNTRDLRTIQALFPLPKIERKGLHNALEDAKFQAEQLRRHLNLHGFAAVLLEVALSEIQKSGNGLTPEQVLNLVTGILQNTGGQHETSGSAV